MDKRVQKTRHLIKTTVAKMLKTKSLDRLSVSDIAAQSLIQRATFYNHYGSVYDVVTDIRNDITAYAAAKFEDIDFSAIRSSVKPMLSRIAAVVRALPPEYRDLLLCENENVLKDVRKWFIDNTVAKIEQNQRKLNEYERYSAEMFINGLIDAFYKWRSTRGEKPDYYEFVCYAARVAEFGCVFVGVE